MARAWKAFTRSSSREAEESMWEDRAAHAVRHELKQLSPVVLEAGRRAVAQPDFFGGIDPAISLLARTAIDRALLRCLPFSMEADRDVALEKAVCTAVETVVDAQMREARVHIAEADPKDCLKLMTRMDRSLRALDLPRMISDEIAGKPVTAPRSQSIDYEEDLRGPRGKR
jgi:hypothetical protein